MAGCLSARHAPPSSYHSGSVLGMATNRKTALNVRISADVDTAVRAWAERRNLSLASAVDLMLGTTLGIYDSLPAAPPATAPPGDAA